MSLNSDLEIIFPLKSIPLLAAYVPAARSIPLCPLLSFAKPAFKVLKLGFNSFFNLSILAKLNSLAILLDGSDALISFSISPLNISVSIAS